MTQYLAKFLPRLSDMTKALRDLTVKDVDFRWDEPQQAAFDALKSAVSSTPVLRYYNLEKEVTLQCDASQSGLGAALMQAGQPVAFALRALAAAETRYAQIEKELLAVLCACQRFDAYVYGRANVKVESDHKPLEMIMRKTLDAAPKRLAKSHYYSMRAQLVLGQRSELICVKVMVGHCWPCAINTATSSK